MQGGLACAEGDREVAALLAAHRGRTRQALLERFEKAVADGDLPEDTDCRALALCVVAAAQGLNVEAAPLGFAGTGSSRSAAASCGQPIASPSDRARSGYSCPLRNASTVSATSCQPRSKTSE